MPGADEDIEKVDDMTESYPVYEVPYRAAKNEGKPERVFLAFEQKEGHDSDGHE